MPLARNHFVFGGESSMDHFLTIEHTPEVRGGAEPDLEGYEIPGRDGTVYVDRGRRKNVSVVYETYLKVPDRQDISRYLTDVKRWLLGSPGQYRRLEDTYDPDHYRLAVYAGGLDVRGEYRRFTQQILTFSCLPYRYRKSGEVKLDLLPGTVTLQNDTGFTALPRLEIAVSTPGSVLIIVNTDGKVVFTPFNFPTGGTFTVDCERKSITDSSGREIYGLPEKTDFPKLPPGRNRITLSLPPSTATAEEAGIIPNLREL